MFYIHHHQHRSVSVMYFNICNYKGILRYYIKRPLLSHRPPGQSQTGAVQCSVCLARSSLLPAWGRCVLWNRLNVKSPVRFASDGSDGPTEQTLDR